MGDREGTCIYHGSVGDREGTSIYHGSVGDREGTCIYQCMRRKIKGLTFWYVGEETGRDIVILIWVVCRKQVHINYVQFIVMGIHSVGMCVCTCVCVWY